MDRPKNVVSEAAIPWEEESRGTRHGWRRKKLGLAAGGSQLGCSLMELPPGKRSFPLHWHRANEEAVFVLAGRGTLRLGSSEVAVAAGDYVVLAPVVEQAHQLINDGPETLRYLAFSTTVLPDVVSYPDSKKVFALTHRTANGSPRGGIFREESAVDYWDGES